MIDNPNTPMAPEEMIDEAYRTQHGTTFHKGPNNAK